MWDVTENELRYRVREPNLFKPDSFRYKEIKSGPKGINLVIGKLKKNGKNMIVQAVRFKKKTEDNKKGWELKEAKKWIKTHSDLSKASLFIGDEEIAYSMLVAFGMEANAVIKKIGGKYYVYSHEGKKLSDGYDTREEALERLREIEYFKHRG